MRWAAEKGFDGYRKLSAVGWSGREINPKAANWREIECRVLDWCYDTLGLRGELTIDGKGSGADPIWLAREVAGIVAEGRQHKTMLSEMQNEYLVGGNPIETLSAMAREVEARVPNMAMLSCPDETEAGGEAMRKRSMNEGLQTMTRHLRRSGSDYGWGDVRQGYDHKNDTPLVGWNGEPLVKPNCKHQSLQLTMLRR
jgi:hypothetical protein